MTRSLLWRVVAPLAAAALALLPLPAERVEVLYSSGLYPRLQPALTRASNLLPFALLDVLIAVAAAWLVWRIARRWRSSRRSRWRSLLWLLWDLAAAAAALYLVFLGFWGLNYQRRPPAERFDVVRERVTSGRLAGLGRIAVSRLNTLYGEARGREGEALSTEAVAARLQQPFLRALARTGQTWDPEPGRAKTSLVARLFPLAAVDGVMNPLALEVILNPEVLPFERPAVLAHEWAHLAGHARESEASFVGWLACVEGDAALQYSGWLLALLYTARSAPDGAAVMARLDAGPRGDIAAVRQRLQRVQPLVHRTTWRVYDRYLRANRVESGVANYDEVVILILGSRYADPYLSAP